MKEQKIQRESDFVREFTESDLAKRAMTFYSHNDNSKSHMNKKRKRSLQ